MQKTHEVIDTYAYGPSQLYGNTQAATQSARGQTGMIDNRYFDQKMSLVDIPKAKYSSAAAAKYKRGYGKGKSKGRSFSKGRTSRGYKGLTNRRPSAYGATKITTYNGNYYTKLQMSVPMLVTGAGSNFIIGWGQSSAIGVGTSFFINGMAEYVTLAAVWKEWHLTGFSYKCIPASNVTTGVATATFEIESASFVDQTPSNAVTEN